MGKTIHDNSRQALLAYLAGLLDGEGSVCIKKTQRKKTWNYSYAPDISLGMTCYKGVKLFADTFGINVHQEKPRGIQKRVMYRCHTSGTQKTTKILKELLPYLIVKRKQAELVIKLTQKFNSRKFDKRKKCLCCGRIRKIQGRGLCPACYARKRKSGEIKNYTQLVYNDRIPDFELKRREKLYQMMKKLNAVEAAAETKRDQSQKDK